MANKCLLYAKNSVFLERQVIKIYVRYKESGLEGLNDRSRRPHRYANQLPFQLEKEILKVKKEKPSWGTPKIR
ncbi:TPA: helix-turn-helix domain-containing protein, partial [Legionella pneumophila]